MRRFAIVIEDSGANYAAYVPDLPGCVATGATIDEVHENIRGAIELHVEGMLADGELIPEPATTVGWVDVPAGTAG